MTEQFLDDEGIGAFGIQQRSRSNDWMRAPWHVVRTEGALGALSDLIMIVAKCDGD